MAVTVPNITTHRKPQAITHYAYLGDVYGTAVGQRQRLPLPG